MKKIFLLILLVVMGLVACSEEEPTPTPTQMPAQEATPEPTQATAEEIPPTPTAIRVSETVGQPATADTINNIVWEWNDLEETEPAGQSVVPNPSDYTIRFFSDGNASIKADCNVVGATYTINQGEMMIAPGASTKKACGDDSLEGIFLNTLSSTSGARLESGRLILSTNNDSARMGFNNGGMTAEIAHECTLAVDPSQLNLNTIGLPYSWQANCVPAKPYDESTPPGPLGLPEHIQINFGNLNPEDKQPGDPVIYIIPVEPYLAMWEQQGNDAVQVTLGDLETLLAEKPDPFPESNIPVLPFEEIGGANDIAAQGTFLDFGDWEGVRFVGRHSQGVSSLSNDQLRYFFQGFSPAGEYLISFFYPVQTSMEEPPQTAAELSQLRSYEWMPNLLMLDDVISSLEYAGTQVIEPLPPVELPEPLFDQPYGRVIADSGVNIRTGPGSNYPIYGVARSGEEGEIVGQSPDGRWWVTPIEGAPSGQGWVNAAYVQAFNTENVPAIQPPIPPVPTPTPTPVPAPEPSINFWNDHNIVNQGQCTNLRWVVTNVQAVWIYPQGEDFGRFPVKGNGSRHVCPNVTTTYEMRILHRNGNVEFRTRTIQVDASNMLANTSWVLNSMNVNEVPVPGTNVNVTFGFGNSLSGSGGCNGFNGSYSVGVGNRLFISPLVISGALCSGEIGAQEQQFFTLLQSASFFSIENGFLILYNAGGQETIRFNRIG